MLIFEDSASNEFINKYSTDKITFVRYSLKRDVCTYRHYCYLNYLKKNQSRFAKILCLDCSDLELYKDPFPLINDSILIGSEKTKIEDNVFIVDQFRKAGTKIYYPKKKVLNCGIMGGNHNSMVILFEQFKLFTQHNKDIIEMAIFNKLIYDNFKYKTGHPVHTVFGEFESEESGCYIRHK